MILSQEFEKVIEHLPDIIMKNDVFIKAYKKRKEVKMSKKDFFSKVVNELEVEFNYDPEKVKDIVGEQYYTNVCSLCSKLDESNVNFNTRPVIRCDELPWKEFEEYFGCLLTNEVWLLPPEEYKKDPFKYVYIVGMFLRCMRKIYGYFFIDVEKTIKYMSRTNNIWSFENLKDKILDALERSIVINGAMGVDGTIYHSLVREVRWVLEKNIDIDNYNIYMDVDEIEKEEGKKEEGKKEEEKKEEEKKEEGKKEEEKKEEEKKEEGEKEEGKKEEEKKEEEKKEEGEKEEDKEDDENLYLIKINKNGCFDAKTNMRLTLESKTQKDTTYWEKKVIDSEVMLSPYINLGYQAKIVLNEKMKKVLCGEGNVAGIGTRLKYLGFLRKGVGDYEAFVIEKQSGFYLTYILMEGMIKNRLLQIKDLKQIEKYQKSKLKIIEKYMGKLLLLDNVRPILNVIKREFKRYKDKKTTYVLPNRKNQLILIMFYLLSAIHSADISMTVASCVMKEIETIQNFSDDYIEKMLININNMLLEWVKKFNCQYDFLMETMVYMYSYKKTDERLKYLENVEVCPGSREFVYVDNIMQKAYDGEYSEITKKSLKSPLMLKKMFSLDSECTEQRIQSIINSYIIHGSYPIEFEFTK